jgi:hypothetical protein
LTTGASQKRSIVARFAGGIMDRVMYQDLPGDP